jgi:HSP20 family protein
MPFFPQAVLSSQPTLFDILSALDEPQGKSCARAVRRHTPQTFTPKFDVTENGEAYELYGEVPGLQQQNLSIEFSDAQTIVIKGKIDRVAKPAQQSPMETETSDTASEKSHNATVEDEYDEADAPLATPASTSTATAAATEEKSQEQTPKPKYWVAERRVGEFARSFSFEQRIEQDFVHAQLKNGILYVVVPKSQKSRKVAVTVA